MDKLVFALEKLIALISSQRFITAVVSIVVIVVVVQGIAAAVFGFDPWQAPDEADLNARVEALVAQAVTVLGALLAIAQVVTTLIKGITERPPSNVRADYTFHNR